ncbi:MAG: Flp pilus assembly complex ATPase component TadA [Deltaproteobacteria bacterium]|nr:Flp pilus assembly complex ATPase component TadA [Deltaproteobacteria bacterium]
METKVEEIITNFNKMIVAHVLRGVTEFHLRPAENLKVMVNDSIVENNKIPISEQLLEIVLKKIISENQNKSFEGVEKKDFVVVSGGNLDYDIFIDSPSGQRLRTLKCLPTITDKEQIFIKMVLEPEIRIGYPEVAEVYKIGTEEELESWFDDFATNILAMNNPRPKDILLQPNKMHPYVIVTGGLRPITDVVLSTGFTNRIANLLVRLSNNPSIIDLLRKNDNSFDNLDIDIAYRTKVGRRFRVNIADVFDAENEHGCLITMRLLPEKPFTVKDLSIPKILVDTTFNLKMGLVIISGTTGSGKSTTMGAMIDFLLKNKSVNLLTIENPIETIFPSMQYPKSAVSQREVGKHALSQSKAMESAVRQTLNVAMVGEIRNDRDAMMAIELAQSGHLIFATLHAGTTGESIDRIVEMFPSEHSKKIRELLSTHYKLGIAQTLVKGVQGQTELAMEIFLTNADIKAFIAKTQKEDRQFSMREIIEMYTATGCMSYDQCLVKLFNEGKINEDIMMFNSPDKDALIYRQGKLGVKLSAKWDPVGSKLDKAFDDLFVQREMEKQSQ